MTTLSQEGSRSQCNRTRKLSESPPQANADDVEALQKVGLKDDEILDLILSTSLFGWANRLMHVLGDPMQPDEDL